MPPCLSKQNSSLRIYGQKVSPVYCWVTTVPGRPIGQFLKRQMVERRVGNARRIPFAGQQLAGFIAQRLLNARTRGLRDMNKDEFVLVRDHRLAFDHFQIQKRELRRLDMNWQCNAPIRRSKSQELHAVLALNRMEVVLHVMNRRRQQQVAPSFHTIQLLPAVHP